MPPPASSNPELLSGWVDDTCTGCQSHADHDTADQRTGEAAETTSSQGIAMSIFTSIVVCGGSFIAKTIPYMG